MNLFNLSLILVMLCAPAQDRLLLATGTKAVGSLTFLPTEQRLDTHDQQPSNNAETAPMSSQSQSVRIFEGIGKLHIELTLDGFGIRPLWGQLNASFSIIYQFEIGEDCHPMHLLLLAGERYIDSRAAETCLAKWTLAGLEAWKKYILVLNWEHMRGYVSMSLFSDQLSLSIRLLKDKTGS